MNGSLDNLGDVEGRVRVLEEAFFHFLNSTSTNAATRSSIIKHFRLIQTTDSPAIKEQLEGYHKAINKFIDEVNNHSE